MSFRLQLWWKFILLGTYIWREKQTLSTQNLKGINTKRLCPPYKMNDQVHDTLSSGSFSFNMCVSDIYGKLFKMCTYYQTSIIGLGEPEGMKLRRKLWLKISGTKGLQGSFMGHTPQQIKPEVAQISPRSGGKFLLLQILVCQLRLCNHAHS